MNKSLVIQDLENISKRLEKVSSKLSGTTLLITGGSGFIGTYFIYLMEYLNKKVLKQPARVISIDNNISSTEKIFRKPSEYITHVRHDVRKQIKLHMPIDYIIHAAGIASPVYYSKFPLETLEVGTYGTQHMLNVARRKKIKSFLFFSSSEIYGDPDPKFVPTPETYWGNVSSIGPRACYDESKRLGETLCMVYYSLYKIPVKIIRPFNIYGPGMRENDYRVIPAYVSNALAEKPLLVHDSGEHTRSFCYITDALVATMLVLLSSKNGEVYNIGNDTQEITMLRLAQIIKELLGPKVKIKKIIKPSIYPSHDPQRRKPDLTKIKKKLGFNPDVNLHSGLQRTIDWSKRKLLSSQKKNF